LKTHTQALKIAFTKIISGRPSEARGNGLKFVKLVVTNHPFVLDFQSGNAVLKLKQGDKKLIIKKTPNQIKGCFAKITIKENI